MVVARNRGGGNSEESSGATVDNGSAGVSGYEQFRDQKIRENKERLQKLGILDLALKLKTEAAAPKRPYRPKTHNPLPVSGSPRRSSRNPLSLLFGFRENGKENVAKFASLKDFDFFKIRGCFRVFVRLKSVAPVDYVQKKRPVKKDENPKSPKRSVGSTKTKRSVEVFIKEGSKPEIYSEEHENLLGDCVENWELGVDDYGEDGRRIYDPVKGEFCHQCRYGENVIEASENPDWTCPVCQGICNCRLCHQAKGWEPTGDVDRKVVKLGYKSVAHYLIQTRHAPTNLEYAGEEVVSEGSTPSAEPFSHDESSGTGCGLDASEHVGDNDVGNADGVAVDGEAKKKLRRSSSTCRTNETQV